MTTFTQHPDIDTPRLRSLRREDANIDGIIVAKQSEVDGLKEQQKKVQQSILEECQYELNRKPHGIGAMEPG